MSYECDRCGDIDRYFLCQDCVIEKENEAGEESIEKYIEKEKQIEKENEFPNK